MATVKTLSGALSLGLKCFNHSFLTANCPQRLTWRINVMAHQTRHQGGYGGQEVGDDSLYTGFDVSRDPEEWKAVERLLPHPVVKDPTPKAEYPSGWQPPSPPADSPYHVARTVAHMMPVYLQLKGVRGERKLTYVRRVSGDVWQLERELRAYLRQQYPSPLKVLVSRVDEVAGMVQFKGDHVNYIKRYLSDRGW